ALPCFGEMIHAHAVQGQQDRRKGMHLVIDAAKHVPDRGFIAEMVDGAEAVIPDIRSEVPKILKAAAAVGEGAVSLDTEGGVRWLHLIFERQGENTVPEWRLCLQADATHDVQVGEEGI